MVVSRCLGLVPLELDLETIEFVQIEVRNQPDQESEKHTTSEGPDFDRLFVNTNVMVDMIVFGVGI